MGFGAFLIPESNETFHSLNPISHFKTWALKENNLESLIYILVPIIVLLTLITNLIIAPYLKAKRYGREER